MSYETGAKVKLTRDVQVTGDGAAARTGFPGPLFLAGGLEGVVTVVTREGAGGGLQDELAAFEKRIRDGQFQGFAAHLVEDLRQQLIRHGAFDTVAGTRIRYGVRFENGFVLHGLEADVLTEA